MSNHANGGFSYSNNRNRNNRNSASYHRNSSNRNGRYRRPDSHASGSAFNRKEAQRDRELSLQESLKEQQLAHEFFKPLPDTVYQCPYCGNPIENLSNAIQLKGSQTPVHFDCAVEKIQTEHPLADGQQVAYLGKGAFGIIESTEEKPGFRIVLKIDMEDENEKSSWQKELASRIQQLTETAAPVKGYGQK